MQDQYQTGKQIAEIMSGWMKKNEERAVWDPACGEANVLSNLEEELPGADLHGIEHKPEKAEIAKDKLESADIQNKDFFGSNCTFESLVLDPPISSNFDGAESEIDGKARWGIHQYFTLEAIDRLEPEGSLAVIVPTNSLDNKFWERVTETCKIERAISIPNSKFVSADYTILLGKKTPSSEEIIVISAENIGNIDKSIVYKDTEAVENEVITAEKIETEKIRNYDPRKLLSFPELLKIRESESLMDLDNLFDIKSGIRTGNVDFFYLDPKEADKIDDKLQTPLVKNRPDGFKIRKEDLERSYLDLSVLEEQGDVPQNINERLEKNGFDDALNYMRKENISPTKNHPVQPNGPPDLIKPSIDHNKFYKLEIDQNVALDDNYYGLYSDLSSDYIDIIWKYLNTDIHRKIDNNLQIGSTVPRATKRSLKKYQIPERDLIEKLSGELNGIDLSSKHSIEKIEKIIMTELPEEDENFLKEFDNKDRRLKWAWLLEENNYQEFASLYEENQEKAKKFLSDHIEPGKADGIRKPLEISEINEERKELLKKCLDQFEDGNYDIFLLSAVTQLEGLLLDIAIEKGWEIEDDEIHRRDEKRNIKIGELAQQVVDDNFSNFIQDEIRDWRNDLAHGKEFPEEKVAKIIFGAIAALIQGYNKYPASKEN